MVTQRTIVRTFGLSLTGQSADVVGMICAPSTANASNVRRCAALNCPCVFAMSVPPFTPLVSHSAWDALAAPAPPAAHPAVVATHRRPAFAHARGSLGTRLLTDR
jgi:hypothetical protein